MKKFVSFISLLSISALFGFFTAKHDLLEFRSDTPFHMGDFLTKLTILCALSLALGYLQIIVHEAGHLVCGLVSKYKFVSFRIKSFVLVKVNGQYQIKRFAIPGTGGQCLMDPPGTIDAPGSSILYLFGGIGANLLLTKLLVLLILFAPFSSMIKVCLAIGALIGLSIIVTNGIPMFLSGIPNDMMNVRILRKSQTARKAMFLSLKVNALQTQGTRIGSLPLTWFDVPSYDDTSSYFVSMILLLREGWCLDNYEFDKARQVMDQIEQESQQHRLPQILRYEMNTEKLFLMSIQNENKEEVRQFYEVNAKYYINTTKRFMIGKLRVLWAYTYFIDEDIPQSRLIYEQMLRMREQYPVVAEAQSDIELVDYLLLKSRDRI